MSPQPAAVKQAIIERANGLCEYCKSPSDFSPQPFSIEHVFPISAGGSSDLDNLAYACQGCNNHKYTKTKGIDPLGSVAVPLFHPRYDDWATHFGWGGSGLEIIGIIATGRATVDELHLNRKNLVNLRALLLLADLHPPVEQGFSVKKEKEQKTPELGKVNCPKNQPRQVNHAVYHIESQ